MTRFLAVALGTVCLCLAVAGPLRAQDFDAGWAAYMDENYPAALKHWRPLAEGGHARAQILLASMYATGAGVPRDPATAAAWLRRAADRGDAHGQFALGRAYGKGEGVAKDPAAAYFWFALAAARGHGRAAEARDALAKRLPAARRAAIDARVKAWRPAPGSRK